MRVQKATDQLNGVVREFLSGIRVIRAFNRGPFEQSRFDEKNEQLFGTSTKAMRIMSIFSPGISLTVNFGIVLVLLAGGWNINDGQMQVGEVVAYVNSYDPNPNKLDDDYDDFQYVCPRACFRRQD